MSGFARDLFFLTFSSRGFGIVIVQHLEDI